MSIYFLIRIYLTIRSKRKKTKEIILQEDNFVTIERPKETDHKMIDPKCIINDRNFTSNPIKITISPWSQHLFQWNNNKQMKVEDCELNCIYNKEVTDDHLFTSDGFLHYFTNQKMKKVCPDQKLIYYVMENWPKRSDFDIYATTEAKADIYASYYLFYNDLFKPILPKKEDVIASIFISNCIQQVTSDRTNILIELEENGITIDKFGVCFGKPIGDLTNVSDRKNKKIEVISKYKFYLVFENSKNDGYISEKYWEALEAGAIPVVLGAYDIKQYEPRPGSILHIEDFESVEELAKEMKRIASNPEIYDKMMEWKKIGPSDQFISVLESNLAFWCQICIRIADEIVPKIISNEILVRERGTFYYRPIHLKEFTLEELNEEIERVFENHQPIWNHTNSQFIFHRDKFHNIQHNFDIFTTYRKDKTKKKIYRIMRSGKTYENTYMGRDYIDSESRVKEITPGTKLEVIFV